MKIQLGFKIEEGETPYEAGVRYAERYGMKFEFDKYYKKFKASGDTEEEAVWGALYEWDLLGIIGEQNNDEDDNKGNSGE